MLQLPYFSQYVIFWKAEIIVYLSTHTQLKANEYLAKILFEVVNFFVVNPGFKLIYFFRTLSPFSWLLFYIVQPLSWIYTEIEEADLSAVLCMVMQKSVHKIGQKMLVFILLNLICVQKTVLES